MTITITGIEKDAAGNDIGLWIHDTGVCSNMGNAFYCNVMLKTMLFGKVPLIVRFNMCLKSKKGEYYDC